MLTHRERDVVSALWEFCAFSKQSSATNISLSLWVNTVLCAYQFAGVAELPGAKICTLSLGGECTLARFAWCSSQKKGKKPNRLSRMLKEHFGQRAGQPNSHWFLHRLHFPPQQIYIVAQALNTILVACHNHMCICAVGRLRSLYKNVDTLFTKNW